jgi:Cytidine deaminase
MAEFCSPDMPVILTNTKGNTSETTVAELLPGAFTSKDMD